MNPMMTLMITMNMTMNITMSITIIISIIIRAWGYGLMNPSTTYHETENLNPSWKTTSHSEAGF